MRSGDLGGVVVGDTDEDAQAVPDLAGDPIALAGIVADDDDTSALDALHEGAHGLALGRTGTTDHDAVVVLGQRETEPGDLGPQVVDPVAAPRRRRRVLGDRRAASRDRRPDRSASTPSTDRRSAFPTASPRRRARRRRRSWYLTSGTSSGRSGGSTPITAGAPAGIDSAMYVHNRVRSSSDRWPSAAEMKSAEARAGQLGLAEPARDHGGGSTQLVGVGEPGVEADPHRLRRLDRARP